MLTRDEINSVTEAVYNRLEQWVRPGFEFLAKATENDVKEKIEKEINVAIQRIQEAIDKAPLDRIARLREMRELSMLLNQIGQKEEAQAVAAKIMEELGI